MDLLPNGLFDIKRVVKINEQRALAKQKEYLATDPFWKELTQYNTTKWAKKQGRKQT